MVLFLLYTDDLKQQTGRIIQEIRNNRELKSDDYELMVEVENGTGKYFESAQKFMERQDQVSKDISEALSALQDKIGIVDKLASRIDALEKTAQNQRENNP